jgi:nicotinate dehydrogenase subunit A
LKVIMRDAPTPRPATVPANDLPVSGLPASTVSVNGQRREVRAEPDTALLWVLRHHLDLKGTRFGCGLSLCGSCLVLVDGQAVFSCDTPLWSLDGKEITTIEGLAAADHPVTAALVAGQAAQCGYCVSGIAIAAAELLSRNDDPSEAEVKAALDRNLCRCGSHNRIVRAVLAAAAELRAGQAGTSQTGASQTGAAQTGERA